MKKGANDDNSCSSQLSPFDVGNYVSALATPMSSNIRLHRQAKNQHSWYPHHLANTPPPPPPPVTFQLFHSGFFCLQVPGHMSVYINEPKLSDFKMVLLQEGMQAEFGAGVLICNETVAVRRVSKHLTQPSQHTVSSHTCADPDPPEKS